MSALDRTALVDEGRTGAVITDLSGLLGAGPADTERPEKLTTELPVWTEPRAVRRPSPCGLMVVASEVTRVWKFYTIAVEQRLW